MKLGGLRQFVALAVGIGLVLGSAACKGEGDKPGASANGGSPASGDVLAESRATLAAMYKGTYRAPDGTTRIAAKGKKLALLSPSQANPSASIPINAAAEAGKALGWSVTILDMQYDPRRAPALIREAINSGANAIITGLDCGYAADAYAEAKAKGILIAPLYAFDCTDPTVAGVVGPSQFTTFVNYGTTKIDDTKFIASFGAVAASILIAKTNGTAKVITFTEPTSTILKYTQAGFEEQLARCAGCKLLESVKLASADGPAVNQAKVRDALARHPDVTAIRSSHSSETQLAIAPALVAAGKQNDVMVIGGEGLERDLDLIRTKQGLSLTLSTDPEWLGWAVVDTVNSAFNSEDPRPTGLGAMLIDKEHNLPPSGTVQHNINFRTIYRKAWGVS